MQKCSYCEKDKTRVVFVYICDDKECERKAKESHNSPVISVTTFN